MFKMLLSDQTQSLFLKINKSTDLKIVLVYRPIDVYERRRK